ncbi:HisM ABC-type amino acid transport system, permease component [Burkholderiaceae bacterium]|jgi:general L-amino acid transport system permease protein
MNSSFWHQKQARRWLYQLALLLGLGLLLAWLLSNTLANMKARGIQSGFDFLWANAGFDIGESMIAFDSSEPYWRAFWVGLLNTLRVSVVGIAFCTILGTLIGVGRVSNNALARGMGYAYTELFRNVPVLLQLLIWYVLLVEFMPDSQSPLHFNDWFYLSKNGISFPVPVWDASVPGLVWDVPVWLDGEITQGISLTPEFLAITLGLSFYTSAFVAEVVRAGIVSVPRGQLEAAKSIGLSNWQTTRQVLLPQAMRVIIPPLTNQYLNLTKNSSLAVAIGYPDLVSISNTALNQTGRAVECIALIMAVYLCLSLGTSALMNAFNQRMAIRER